jgi:FkbM family methyltransferase
MLDYGIEQWKQGLAFERYYEEHSKENPMLIVDAGANIGAASVYFNHIYSRAQIIAIEPEKENCELLRLNTTKRPVDVVEGALGAAPGKMYLQDPGLSDYGFRVGAVGEYEVQVFTVEQLLEKYQLNHKPLLLKIDIEGGESSLFEGSCNWLNEFPLVIIELHDWMLPGNKISSGFYRNISALDFDIIQRGENTFCFNNRLLAPYG